MNNLKIIIGLLLFSIITTSCSTKISCVYKEPPVGQQAYYVGKVKLGNVVGVSYKYIKFVVPIKLVSKIKGAKWKDFEYTYKYIIFTYKNASPIIENKEINHSLEMSYVEDFHWFGGASDVSLFTYDTSDIKYYDLYLINLSTLINGLNRRYKEKNLTYFEDYYNPLFYSPKPNYTYVRVVVPVYESENQKAK